jgi:hypothetical protein
MMTIDFRKNRINILVLGIGILTLTLLSTTEAQEKKAQEKKNVAVASTAASDASTAASPVLTAPLTVNPKLPARKPKGTCHSKGDLPDPQCTPGVADSGVTQANIQQTICTSGYSSQIRAKYAPVNYTDALKRQQIREYGYADTRISDYEEDHLISLELGGHPNDPRNLWPEFPHSPNPKDKVEDELHKKVCAGQITLIEAQQITSRDWTKAK